MHDPFAFMGATACLASQDDCDEMLVIRPD